MKKLTITIERCLFSDIIDDVLLELANLSADVMRELANLAAKGRIPKWGSYEIDRIEKAYPVKDYYISLHTGPVETPGRVVALVFVHTVANEDKAEVTVTWDD